MKTYTSEVLEQIGNLLNVSIALSAEKNHNKVLELILAEARKITNADAGTLFLYEDSELVFKIIHNETLNIFKGGQGEDVDLPNVKVTKENVAGYVALTKSNVNIADVYNYQGNDLNFSGPKKYDDLTGYKTTSMLVIPLKDHQEEIIGVLQLINAQDEEGKTIPFAHYFEKVISALASQAAVAISNVRFLDEIEALLYSFVKAMATAIDARTPYNANHTKRVAKMTEGLIKAINLSQKGEFAEIYFDSKRSEELIMAAWLHDIGKIATPLKVMDKSTRLEERLDLILQRLDYIAAENEAKYWKAKSKGEDNLAQYKTRLNHIEEAYKLFVHANSPTTFVDDQLAKKLKKLGNLTYYDRNDKKRSWLSKEELDKLIIPRGTLSKSERIIMQEHVSLAEKILNMIPFPDKLKRVPKLVILHHEFLDGTGYPEGLKKEDIPLEGRILALIDIFDALTAADRPYKKAIPIDKALNILDNMVKEGKLDSELFSLFKEYRPWEAIE